MPASAHDGLLAERYDLVEPLGSGGMAEVWRARDTRLHRDVAVKLFRAGSDLADGLRFDNEVRTLAALSHPGLVQVHDAGTGGDTPFVVLQLVEGRTLRDRITDGPLTPDELRRLGAELAEALAYVHARGVVHRDIKPSNVLLDRDGNAHLADFGLARLLGATRLTRTGQLVGTAAYLAPEQVRGDDFGHPVDVYALGLVLLECLTGRREYEGSEIEAAVARLHRQPDVPDELPADLRRLLTLMTSLSPRRRPSAADCARMLRDPQANPTLAAAPVRERRPITPFVAAAVVTALCAAGVATAFLSPPAEPGESAPPTSTAPVVPVTSSEPPPTAAAQPPVTHTVFVPVQAGPKADVQQPAPQKPAAKDDDGPGEDKPDKEKDKPDKG
ncbi:hypothetical protein BBK82_42595 [Lentzea guizhouensis]|uniref:non-specific serine/threonine protein kinase n=1 Tax=Lentzea guizhouensis TaxID=1586287 RepID=A0A1B2HVA3_9PSEU|nr:serine/threonine-protein kinase [Lentzea guizhouensis]ANZ41651.1 hypothetical protein BBK82_42595 [Lentzea guizhouensis]